MTEHSIEELKRQLAVAQSKFEEASNKLKSAKAALERALVANAERAFSAKGIEIGARVKVTQRHWTGSYDVSSGIYLGHQSAYGRSRPVVAAIKKDGTAHGVKRISADDSEITIEAAQ